MKYITLFLTLLLTACSQNDHTITKIPEASGICYSKTSDTLFVTNDEGKAFEIDTNGKILKEKKLGKFDLEGVACDDKNNVLLFAVEKKDNILVVDQNSMKILKKVNIKRKYQGSTLLSKHSGDGIEGITIFDDKILLSNQSYDKATSFLFEIDAIKGKKASITDVIYHGFIDIAGLTVNDGFLYMLSDQENLLIKYDLEARKSVFTKELSDFAGEGIAFDKKGNVYFADDNGAVLKYTRKELGL